MYRFILFLFFLPTLLSGEALLNSTICLRGMEEAVYPGKPLFLTASVRNSGSGSSNPGTIQIRFAFPSPIDDHPQSVIFETEALPLPKIPPGGEVHVAFETPHLLPTIADYFRDNFAMRHYEAVIEINGEKQTSGSRALLVSATYYLSCPLQSQASFNSPE